MGLYPILRFWTRNRNPSFWAILNGLGLESSRLSEPSLKLTIFVLKMALFQVFFENQNGQIKIFIIILVKTWSFHKYKLQKLRSLITFDRDELARKPFFSLKARVSGYL